ncbi:MAG: DNA alkylation repair protein [Verrucomicrobiota bacterium]
MTEKGKLFKDWFDRDAATSLAKQVASAYPDFDQKTFVRRATRGLSELEFHARVKHFSEGLAVGLPPAPEALEILVHSLPDPLPNCEAVTDGWLLWPVGHFIGEYGLDYYAKSMRVMTELTMRFSAEFPVRYFIERYPERTMQDLLKLTSHPNPHVRRWCSEGCRPRLPWGQQLRDLIEDPTPIWPILEALKDDPELYVRRSVANNLNDIAKDHPEQVVRRCRVWMKGASLERAWVVRHGLRSLIKQGNPAALQLLGYGKPDRISGILKIQPDSIWIGESLELKAVLKNAGKCKQSLMIDYAVYYVRQGGKTSAKVFKWKTLELAVGQRVELTKKHPMRQTSVRALYPGQHTVELQINGERLGCGEFRLKV